MGFEYIQYHRLVRFETRVVSPSGIWTFIFPKGLVMVWDEILFCCCWCWWCCWALFGKCEYPKRKEMGRPSASFYTFSGIHYTKWNSEAYWNKMQWNSSGKHGLWCALLLESPARPHNLVLVFYFYIPECRQFVCFLSCLPERFHKNAAQSLFLHARRWKLWGAWLGRRCVLCVCVSP